MTNIITLDFGDDTQKLTVGLSWDHNEQKQGALGDVKPHNLDLNCALLNDKGQIIDILTPQEPQREKYKGEIFHLGDHLSGGSDFEDEEVQIQLDALAADIVGVAIVVSAHNGVKFSDVRNPELAYLNGITFAEFLKINLNDVAKPHTVAGVISKTEQGSWVLKDICEDVAALDKDILQMKLDELLV